MIADANRQIENTIRTIREAQAEKELTQLARKELNDFRDRVEGRMQRMRRTTNGWPAKWRNSNAAASVVPSADSRPARLRRSHSLPCRRNPARRRSARR